MCELLVMNVNRSSENPYLDARLLKRGDVVTIQDDGWEWGKAEGLPTFQVIFVPGVAAEAVQYLLGQEFPLAVHQRCAQRRVCSLEIDKLVVGGINSLSQLEAATVRKSVFVDPNVIE